MKKVIELSYHVTGTTHSCGYCSDPGEISNIDYKKTIRINFNLDTRHYIEGRNSLYIDKEFVENNFTEDGFLNYDGLEKMSFNSRDCNGSGYCGTGTKWACQSGKLIEEDDNIRSIFLKN